jgi:hypothetical protein
MYFCYLDESGTSDSNGTSHFVYLGIAIPANQWRSKDLEIDELKLKYNLKDIEVHTAWMVRKYPEQLQIANFEKLTHAERKNEVLKKRHQNLLAWVVGKKPNQLKEKKKFYNKTEAYIHLTFEERVRFINELAEIVGNWSDSRAFCECIKKNKFSGDMYESAFQQVVTRFETFLSKRSYNSTAQQGLLISDNNETVNRRLTLLMRKFHTDGTIWRKINHIVETPLFVDSQLTSMIQVADLMSFATRRYFENSENELFDKLKIRFDRHYTRLVGIRHFTPGEKCGCNICLVHK